MASDGGPFRPTPDGLLVDLRLQPNASRERIEGCVRLDDGSTLLKVRVGAPPEAGKANAALIRLLAKTWKLPRSSFSLVAGQTARRKTLLIAGDAAALRPGLEAWLAGLKTT